MNAVDDRANRVAKRATGTSIVIDFWQVGLGVEFDCLGKKLDFSFLHSNFQNYLISGIVTCHVTLSTVDAHVRIDQSNNVLFVVFEWLAIVGSESTLKLKLKNVNLKLTRVGGFVANSLSLFMHFLDELFLLSVINQIT